MHILKRLGRGLLALFFKLFLFAFAIVTVLIMVFGTPAQLKHSLKDSGAYNSYVDSALQTAQKQTDKNNGDIPLDRPEIKAAAQAAFPPEFLQAHTERVLDGTYHWLDGKTASPDFKIDLTPAKQNFANALGDYALKRAQSLPACTLQQARQLQASGDIDPFNVPCLPPGFNPTSIRNKVVNDIANNKEFLQNPVITADTLAKDGNPTPFQKAKQVPKIFHWLKIAPYILGFLAVACGLGLVLLHDERRRGLRVIGFILLGSGIFLFLNIWLLNYLLGKLNEPTGPIGKLAADTSQRVLLGVSSSLNKALTHKLFLFCLAYSLLGIGLLIYLRLTRQPVTIDQLAHHDGGDKPNEELLAQATEKAHNTHDNKQPDKPTDSKI